MMPTTKISPPPLLSLTGSDSPGHDSSNRVRACSARGTRAPNKICLLSPPPSPLTGSDSPGHDSSTRGRACSAGSARARPGLCTCRLHKLTSWAPRAARWWKKPSWCACREEEGGL